MTWQEGDKVFIRHKPGKAFTPDIIIPCTIVKIYNISGKAMVDSENQKGIIVPLGLLERDGQN